MHTTSAFQTLSDRHCPRSRTPALFAYSGQSNITNSKLPFSVLAYAAARRRTPLHHAARRGGSGTDDTNRPDEYPCGLRRKSFYKMFGFPTGIGDGSGQYRDLMGQCTHALAIQT